VIWERRGRPLDDLNVLDDLLCRFAAAPEQQLRVRVAEALAHKVRVLLHLGRDDEAMTITRALALEFRDERDPQTLIVRAAGINEAAEQLAAHAHLELALSMAQLVVDELVTVHEPELRRIAAQAQLNLAVWLTSCGSEESENATEAFLRYGEDALPLLEHRRTTLSSRLDEPRARADYASVAVLSAALLGYLGRTGAAIAELDAFIALFDDDDIERIPALVERAVQTRSVLREPNRDSTG
jgi:tetratricopeptide (TPR) repeat protein